MSQSSNKPDVFAAISDPTRRRILSILAGSTLTINALAGNFDISRPAISKHIKMLEEAGLISIEPEGRERYCSLNPNGFAEIRDWLSFYEHFWQEKMKKFEAVLNNHAAKKHKE